MTKNTRSITLLIMFSLLLLTACGTSADNVDTVEVIVGESVKFSKVEIEQAVESVKEKFKEFEHCELHSLTYDEAKSDPQLKDYREDVAPENTIVIFSDFYVNSQAGGAWNPNSDYYWMFILSRDDKNSDWTVDDWGY